MNKYLFSIVFFISISGLLMAAGNFVKPNHYEKEISIAKEGRINQNLSTTIDYKLILSDEVPIGKLFSQRTNNLGVTITPDPIKRGFGFTVFIENTNEEAELRILDILGKLVLKKNIKGFYYVDTIMERGVYLLIIKNSTNSYTRKMIVE